jgi:hypothetical protein
VSSLAGIQISWSRIYRFSPSRIYHTHHHGYTYSIITDIPLSHLLSLADASTPAHAQFTHHTLYNQMTFPFTCSTGSAQTRGDVFGQHPTYIKVYFGFWDNITHIFTFLFLGPYPIGAPLNTTTPGLESLMDF